jgi:hypothetical protein
MDRLHVNCKYNAPFFFAHSKLSKYFVEHIDFVLKCEHLLSPQARVRVREGSFVNVRGGKGNNVEADLVQEHSVRNRKDLIRHLGANKTEKAICRAAGAGDAVASIVKQLDSSLEIRTKSSRHTKHTSEVDLDRVAQLLRKVKPFSKVPGRQCAGYKEISASPFAKVDLDLMKVYMSKTIQRLCRGQIICTEDDDDEQDEHDGLPEL